MINLEVPIQSHGAVYRDYGAEALLWLDRQWEVKKKKKNRQDNIFPWLEYCGYYSVDAEKSSSS